MPHLEVAPFFLVKPTLATASHAPIRRQIPCTVEGRSDSPIWYLGNLSFSMMRARCPCIDTKDAAVEPAGPPPTITTSNSSIFNLRPARWIRSVLGATIPSSWLGVFIVIGGYGNGEPGPTQGDADRPPRRGQGLVLG